MNIKINLVSTSLGDTIGSVAQVDKFQKNTGHRVGFFINPKFEILFKKSYPNIKFNPINFSFDEEKNIHFNFHKPLQKGFSDDLGIEYKEENTQIDDFESDNDQFLQKKFVTLSFHSTHQGRYWNNPNEWNKLILYLKNKYNIRTICIDLYENFGSKNSMNCVPKKSVKRCGMSLDKCASYIRNSMFHIGTSNGLSWLAHACNKHVVLISNVTKKWCEFSTNITRIDDESICHGCLNEEKFDSNNWLWCPRNKKFECTSKITFNSFKSKIDDLVLSYES